MPNPFSGKTLPGLRVGEGGLFSAFNIGTTPQERMGTSRAAVFERIEAMRQQGLRPNDIIGQVLGSPEFQEAFVNDPNITEAVQQFVQASREPVPETITGAPGTEIFSKDPFTGELTSQRRVPTAAPEAVRTFEHMSAIAGLSDEARTALAREMLNAQAAGMDDMTAGEAAWYRLWRGGVVDEVQRDKGIASAITTMPVIDPGTGQTTGHVLIDKTGQVGVPIPFGGAPAPGAALDTDGVAEKTAELLLSGEPFPEDPNALWNRVTTPSGDPVTGMLPGAQRLGQRWLGQVGMNLTPESLLEFSKTFDQASGTLLRALQVNGRAPVAEIQRILSDTDIKPRAGLDERTLRANLIEAQNEMSRRLFDALRAKNDSTLGFDERRTAGADAVAYSNFIRRLNIPPGATSEPQGRDTWEAAREALLKARGEGEKAKKRLEDTGEPSVEAIGSMSNAQLEALDITKLPQDKLIAIQRRRIQLQGGK